MQKYEQRDQTFLILIAIGGEREVRVACRPRDGHEYGERGFDEGWVTLVDPFTLKRWGSCGITHFEQEAIPVALFQRDLPPGPERAPNLPWGRHA